LGRALLSQAAIDAMVGVADHPINLEFDLIAGKRGKREETLESLLVELSGAEAATVVNNNAAAVLLGLNTLAEGKEVIVSRGELIEIGGAFRIPEIMAKSGAILREVGATNRTHPADYENAINEETSLLLKVHTSNYKVVGFTAEVMLEQLVAIGQKHNLPVMEDLGSGALIDLSRYGLPREPIVSERIEIGAGIVTFSGDKILGGPQAGLIVGKKDLIGKMNRNHLQRALRCGKLTLAALEATLRRYRQSPNIVQEIPTLRAFTRPIDEIRAMGEAVAGALGRDLRQVGVYGREGLPGERTRKEIGVFSLRSGDVVGEHSVIFAGAGERLELSHRATSRRNFAAGALRAAAFVAEKRRNGEAGLFDMRDVLGIA